MTGSRRGAGGYRGMRFLCMVISRASIHRRKFSKQKESSSTGVDHGSGVRRLREGSSPCDPLAIIQRMIDGLKMYFRIVYYLCGKYRVPRAWIQNAFLPGVGIIWHNSCQWQAACCLDCPADPPQYLSRCDFLSPSHSNLSLISPSKCYHPLLSFSKTYYVLCTY